MHTPKKKMKSNFSKKKKNINNRTNKSNLKLKKRSKDSKKKKLQTGGTKKLEDLISELYEIVINSDTPPGINNLVDSLITYAAGEGNVTPSFEFPYFNILIGLLGDEGSSIFINGSDKFPPKKILKYLLFFTYIIKKKKKPELSNTKIIDYSRIDIKSGIEKMLEKMLENIKREFNMKVSLDSSLSSTVYYEEDESHEADKSHEAEQNHKIQTSVIQEDTTELLKSYIKDKKHLVFVLERIDQFPWLMRYQSEDNILETNVDEYINNLPITLEIFKEVMTLLHDLKPFIPHSIIKDLQDSVSKWEEGTSIKVLLSSLINRIEDELTYIKLNK